MEDSAAKGLKEKRKKRSRVARIKTAIASIFGVWLLASAVICSALMFRVHSLEEKLDYLLDNFTVKGQMEAEENQSTSDTDESMYFNLESQSDGAVEEYRIDSRAAVQNENLAEAGDAHKAYLTFDDGPSGNTAEILDILQKHGVKATFFVIGREGEAYKDLYRRIVDEGHTLAMHSYSHKYSSLYQSPESFEADFSRIQNYLYEVTGKECLYYRFPGGSSNHVSKTDMTTFISFLNDRGVTYFDWNVSSGDATSQAYTPEELVENVVTDVEKYKTSIVLMHDAEGKASTAKALEPMIEALQGMGVEILPIDEDTAVVQHIAASSVEQ